MAILSKVRLALVHALKADEVLNDARGWTINLAIFRIVFLSFGVLPWALLFLHWTDRILPGISPDMWVPVSFYRLIPPAFLGNVGLAHALAVADIVLIALGIVGFCTRSSIALATLISLYGFGLMQNLGKIDHHSPHLVWFMALLAAGPSGHFLSVDALRAAIKSADAAGTVATQTFDVPIPSPALWTLRYVWLLFGLLYLGAGIAKLQSALREHWASSDNIRNILFTQWIHLYRYDPHFTKPLRVDLLPNWVLVLLGLSVVAFEVGFIFLVLFRRVRPALGLAGLAFHVGNGLALDIWFTGLMWGYASLFDWTAMGRAIARQRHEPLSVFYDEKCRLCRRTIAILRSLDLFDALKPVAGLPDGSSRDSYLQITREMLDRDMYAAAGGHIAAGYDAYVWIAKRLFLLRPVAAIMRSSPVATLGRKVYRHISQSQHCAMVTPGKKGRAHIRSSKSTVIHRVGLVLLVCQLSVSSAMFAYILNAGHSPSKAPWLRTAQRRIDGIGRRKPIWPFDLYPTFIPAYPSEVQLWEARWVTSSGREMRISPAAYNDSLGNGSITASILSRMLVEENPDGNRARSLELVQLLWRNERPDIRQSVAAVNIYRAEYRLHGSDDAPVILRKESLLHTFPVKLFAPDGLSPFSGASPSWPQ